MNLYFHVKIGNLFLNYSIDYGNCFHDDNLPAHFEAYSTCENAIFSEKQFA